jgi:hypothetical protein
MPSRIGCSYARSLGGAQPGKVGLAVSGSALITPPRRLIVHQPRACDLGVRLVPREL